MGIGYRIQKCRENKGLKQEELAEKVDLSCNYLSAIEREVNDVGIMQQFKEILSEAQIKSYIFYSEKNDNMNCGQLLSE